MHDMMGWNTGYLPKHARKYADLVSIMNGAFQEYIEDVRSGRFPGEEHSFPMDESELEGL